MHKRYKVCLLCYRGNNLYLIFWTKVYIIQ